jgi:outer membrane protein assembly factor BamA
MLAFIFGFFTVFSMQGSVISPAEQTLGDTLKLPGKLKITDSTGHFISVNRIFIIGNRVTRDRIILRELSFKPGDIVYSGDLASLIDLDKKKLFNTRLFNTVEIRTLEAEPNKIDLLVDLKERWYTFPSPIFELSDRNFNEWWQNYNHSFKRVYYGLRLYQFNMRGRNETLRLHAQGGFQRRFDIQYRIPYIDLNQKQGLSFDYSYLETKNVAYRTVNHKYQFLQADHILRSDHVAGVTYNYRRSFYKTHSLRLEYRNISVQDTVKTANPNFIRGETATRQIYTFLTYQFNADHRDYIAYPLKGYALSASISKVGLGARDDVNKVEATFVYSRHFPLPKKFNLSNNFNVYWSNPTSLSYLNYGVLGLRKQFVRGYEVYVIEGPWYFLNKTTFKKLIFTDVFHWNFMPIEQFRHIPISIYMKTYADFGYVRNYPYYEKLNQNTLLSDKLLSGGGFGLDVVGAYDLVMRFEYSFNGLGQHGFFFNLKKEF